MSLLSQKSIVIATCKPSGVQPWDPSSIKEGIAGAEEAVIYLAQAFAKIGFRVVVVGDPPALSPYRLPNANPRFISSNEEGGELFDIAISWRMPAIAKMLQSRARKVYFWPHDICFRPIDEKKVEGFDDVLWLSSWQRSQWISLCPGFATFTKIFGNGIEASQFKEVKERENPYSCIYGSNYARGLDLLLDVWPEVKGKFPAATLDIYYGRRHWGLLTKEKEEQLLHKLDEVAGLDIFERGLVGHEELNRAYEKASLWTYPCILPETFCITALRAQLAGAIPVIIKGSALKETVRFGYACEKQEEYLTTLLQAMQEVKNSTLAERKMMGNFVLQEFTWEKLALKMKALFEE